MVAVDLEEMWARWGRKTVLVEPSGCWLYMGATQGTGYGMVGKPGAKPKRPILLHRLVYEETVEPIPDGFTIDHMCHNDVFCTLGENCWHRRCWNPAHLRAVTNAENQAATSDGRRQTSHCHRGHEWTEENTHIWRNRRRCKTCMELRNAQRRQGSSK